jgi:hypothetical protein
MVTALLFAVLVALKRKGGLEQTLMGEKKIAAEAKRKLSSLFLKVAFVFEPATPRLISYYVGQTLKKWQQQNLILEYKTRTRRLGKFHYKTQIDVELNSRQTAYILDDWAKKIKKLREVV